jgi:hypothetical protein
MTTNVPGNINTIFKGTSMRKQLNVTFKNGKKNTVYMYPRTYATLANRYLNSSPLAAYTVNPNSINWETLRQFNRNQAKNLLEKNYIIVNKKWPAWINVYFGYQKGWHRIAPQIKTFIEKSKQEQRTPNVRYVNGKYVKVPTMRNRAAFVLKRIREQKSRLAKIKFALVHAFNYERARRRYNTKKFAELTFQNLAV